MILTCPNCGTQYVVKDGAVPPQGRQVRCAACKHSWHQDPAPLPDAVEDVGVSAVPAAGPVDAGPSDDSVEDKESPAVSNAEVPAVEVLADENDAGESLAQAALIEPRSGPEAEERAYEEAIIGGQANEVGVAAEFGREEDDFSKAEAVSQLSAESGATAAGEAVAGDSDYTPTGEVLNTYEAGAPPTNAPRATDLLSDGRALAVEQSYQEDEFSPFAERDIAEPRGRSPLMTVLMLVVAIAALAAAFWFFAPADWKARVGLADAGKTPLELMITHPDRQRLASGQESLTIAGRVINPTDTTHAIPPIYAQLKGRGGQVIYSWTIAPPAPSLGPRASASFNSTEVSVPSGGEDLTITLGAPKS